VPATTTAAEPGVEPGAKDIDPKTESNRHFEFGIKLYEDKNTLAALAEFEAAYRQYPSAAALQNIALCQKQLYRYIESRESLARLLREHGGELSPADRSSVEQAMAELGALVGSVRLSVVPQNAEIVLDGRVLSPVELQQPVIVDVGEHRIAASAPGFAPAFRSFRIAGGHTDVPIALQLQEVTGVVFVKASDEQTAIAIDGRPVAFGAWSGRLEPGQHFIQIYREGYEPFEHELDVEAGKTSHVVGAVGDRIDPAERGSSAETGSKPRRSVAGYYGLIHASTLLVRGHPAGFDPASNYDLGWSLGLRAGYRLSSPFGLEAIVESASFHVAGHCKNPSETACGMDWHDYRLDARRFGAALRLFSSSESLRLTTAVGTGVVSHDFKDAIHNAAGLDAFMLLEVGLQANWRHTLWELFGTAVFEGAGNTHIGNFRPYAESNGIQMYGIGLRVGWGEWTKSAQPLPPMPQRSAPAARP
jgi:hypothetical protein